jgi:nitrate reductase assembly molybdenum cofactor insertion protein NarJ
MQNAECMQTEPDSQEPGSARIDPRVRDLLRDAVRWRLLGRLFECPGDAWRRDLSTLAAEVDDPELRAAAEAAIAGATEGQYHSVFGPGGPASPREVSCHETVELGSLMSELTGYYHAFGYAPTTAEAPDHVAVEVGFVAYLRLKAAYALVSGDTAHATTAADAAGRFTSDHLAILAAALVSSLADSDIDYLVRASTHLQARAGRPPARRRLPVIQDPVDDEGDGEFACGDNR